MLPLSVMINALVAGWWRINSHGFVCAKTDKDKKQAKVIAIFLMKLKRKLIFIVIWVKFFTKI
jgi:hypothetical protein